MSDSEVAILRREIRELSEKTDRQYEVKRLEIVALSEKTDKQHAANQASQAQDRETFRTALAAQQQTFSAAMNEQRLLFQEALNKQFIEHFALDKKVDRANTLLDNCIGDGRPGQGRVGALEEAMETMKKFRWQALAVITGMMWAAETWTHHGGR